MREANREVVEQVLFSTSNEKEDDTCTQVHCMLRRALKSYLV